MNRFDVVLAPEAEDDIAQALAWYRERNTTAAEAFEFEAFDVIDRLEFTALGSAADEHGTRRRVMKRHPYSIWFEVQGRTVTVLAVAHHRRRPGYWRT